MRKVKIIVIGAVIATGVVASLLVHSQAQAKFLERAALLRQQDSQMAELTSEYQRLSDLVDRSSNSPPIDRTAELMKLRTEAEALRKQTNELGKQLAERIRSRQPQTAADANSKEYRKQLHEMADEKTGVANALSLALGRYAYYHHGDFPSNWDQDGLSLSRPGGAKLPPNATNEFEIIYQGSRNDLTNVPWGAVAVIREWKSWPTPSGNRAKVYGMASGEAEVVESDDNFQAWEAEHIVPPSSSP